MEDADAIRMLQERSEGLQRHAARLAAEHPDLPSLTLIVMAGDAYSAEQVEKMLKEGKLSYSEAVSHVGSYSRADAMVRWADDGFGTHAELLRLFPEWWSSCDPDDTDPRFLALWKEVRNRNDGYWYDRDPLPGGDELTVFRGQPDGPVGIAWSLDMRIAVKFARGAWARTAVSGGQVLEGRVARTDVLGYLTGRSEAEVVVDPKDVM